MDLDDGLPEEFRRMYFENTKEGVRVVKLEKKISEPFLLVKRALKVGDAWETKFLMGKYSKEELTWKSEVKAEEDKAFRIESVVTRGGTEWLKIVAWFKPGTGDVKREVTFGGATAVQTMKGFCRSKLESDGTIVLEMDGERVKIVSIKPDSSLAKRGLREGDVLKEVEGKALKSLDEAYAALEKAIESNRGQYAVERNGRTIRFVRPMVQKRAGDD